MSQAGLVDIESSHPQIPTSFTTDAGIAIPIANDLEILGTNGISTAGAGKTVTVTGITATAGLTAPAATIGVASFDSNDFTVTAGFVQIAGSFGGISTILTDDGLPAIEADAIGQVDILGGEGIIVTGQGPGNIATISGTAATVTFIGDTYLATDAHAIAGALTTNYVINPSSLKAKLGVQTAQGVMISKGTDQVIESTAAGTLGELLIANTGANPSFGSTAYGDFAFSQLAVGVPRTFSVNNTDVGVGSTANIMVSVPPLGDDGFFSWEIQGTRFYAFGPDNSVANDPMVLTNSSDPSSGDALLTVSNAGVITLFNDLDVSEGGTGVSTFTDGGILIGNGAGDIQVTAGLANGQLLIGAGVGTDPTVASLTSTDGSVVFTAGAGTLDLSAVGVDVDRDNIYYVGKHGADANDGKTPSQAKLTIQAAVTVAVAGDTIVVFPGTFTETITHVASNVTLRAEGKPTNVIITQADANVVDFATYTGIQYKYFGISCTAATTAICTVQGSTGGATFKECQTSMICAANIAAVTQPTVGCLTGAGTLKVTIGKVTYAHTGNGGATANKGAFKTADGGVITLQRINDLDVSCSGTALVTSVGVDTSSTGVFEMNDNKMSVTDPNATIVAGFVYLGGTGITHEFFRNTLHVTATNNAGYGFWSADTASKSRFFYNHIHVEDTAGTSNSFLVGNTATVISQFDDIIADDGVSVTAGGNFECVSSEMDGDLTCRGREAGGVVQANIMNMDNTATAGNAALNLSVGGTTSTGDPYVNFLVTGSNTISMGLDNSAANDPLKITTGATPSAGTELFVLTGTTSAEFNCRTLSTTHAEPTTFTQIVAHNTSDANATDSARMSIVTEDTRGDTYLLFNPHFGLGSENHFEIGQTQADVFQITTTTDTTSANMTGTTIFSATVAGEITMPLQPAFLAVLGTADNNQTGNNNIYTLGSGNALTERYDQNADFNTNGTFTSPVTGRYTIGYMFYLGGIETAMNGGDTNIITSNRTYRSIIPSPGKNYNLSTQLNYSGITDCDMDAADTATITLRIPQGSGNVVDVLTPDTLMYGRLNC